MKHLTLMAASVALLSMPSIANAGWGHQAPAQPSVYNYENCMPTIQPCAPVPTMPAPCQPRVQQCAPTPTPCQPKVQKCKPDVYIHCADPVFPYESGGDWNGCGQTPPPPPPPPPPPVTCCAPTPPPPPVVGGCGVAKPSGIYYYCGSNKRYDAYGRRIR